MDEFSVCLKVSTVYFDLKINDILLSFSYEEINEVLKYNYFSIDPF